MKRHEFRTFGRGTTTLEPYGDERFIWHHSCWALHFIISSASWGPKKKHEFLMVRMRFFFIRAMMIIAFPVNCDTIFSS